MESQGTEFIDKGFFYLYAILQAVDGLRQEATGLSCKVTRPLTQSFDSIGQGQQSLTVWTSEELLWTHAFLILGTGLFWLLFSGHRSLLIT